MSRSLCSPATPLASISGEASTNAEASAGFAPAHDASLGTAQASSTSPIRATNRCPTTSTHGLPVWVANRSPKTSGRGPYGVGVCIHIGSTAWTIGPPSP